GRARFGALLFGGQRRTPMLDFAIEEGRKADFAAPWKACPRASKARRIGQQVCRQRKWIRSSFAISEKDACAGPAEDGQTEVSPGPACAISRRAGFQSARRGMESGSIETGTHTSCGSSSSSPGPKSAGIEANTSSDCA